MFTSRTELGALLPGFAATASVGSLAIAASPDAPDSATGGDLQEIVVTGPKLITDGSVSPTPLTIVDAATLDVLAPTNIPDALNKLPHFSNSQSVHTPNNSSQNSVGNYLNCETWDPPARSFCSMVTACRPQANQTQWIPISCPGCRCSEWTW
jgi:hypothetical protein